MYIQRQRYKHEDWEHCTRTYARYMILQQLATSNEMAGILLDDLAKGAILDCGTRGKLRRKPGRWQNPPKPKRKRKRKARRKP